MRVLSPRRLLIAALLVLAPHPTSAQRTSTPALDPSTWSALRFRHIGPEGNRVSAVAGVAGDPRTYYAGAASGGVFKSGDGGVHWSPVFDKEAGMSIGAITVAPSDPSVVWVGTGESWIRSHISVGFGVFRSTDAGRTWTKVGLENSGRISRIIVHPTNPDVAWVAVQGHGYAPQPERGVWHTRDGGASWNRVLAVSDSAGASDILIDPTNPRILFAAFWQLDIKTWGRISGGVHSGIWKSTDGGSTWRRLVGKGLPTKPLGKINLGMSAANPMRMYALIETGDGIASPEFPDPATGRLWRSDDQGESWKLVSSDQQLAGRTHYYNRFGVTPDDADELYFLTANWAKSQDGGTTISDPPFTQVPGGDHHDIWFDPTDGDRFIVSHDGGVSITTTRGTQWLRRQLPIAQMYHVTVDDRIPYWVYGNRQDGPSARGPSNPRHMSFFGSAIPRGTWQTVGGGESGFATPDPVDTNFVWSSASGYGSVGGIVARHDLRTGMTENYEVWPRATIGHAAGDVKYRFIWNFPLTISPHDGRRVYVGSQHVHVTTDGGRSWKELSPDLTRNDRSRMTRSGGLTPDNIGVEYAGSLMAIAESPVQQGVIWAGSNDGRLQLTRDNGATWTEVGANIRGLLDWGTIAHIHPSKHAAGTAYIAVDGHQVGNFDPWLYRTTDFGRTWTRITEGIPQAPNGYAHVITEDPVTPGLLFAGFEHGLFVSFNDGASWQPLQNNMPRAPVYGVVVQERFGDLVVGTYGRGFWILDDLSALRALTPEVIARPATLFAPRATYRFRPITAPSTTYDDPTTGENPRYGASLNYFLKEPVAGGVKVTIADAQGTIVRTLTGTNRAGINRIHWDLRHEPSMEIRLHTSPMYADHIIPGPEGRVAPGTGRLSILAPPGTYTVTLAAGGSEQKQSLEVRKDPNSGGTLDEINRQVRALVAIRRDMNDGAEAVHRMEAVRVQVQAIARVVDDAEVKRAAEALLTRFTDLEMNLVDLRLTGGGQDGVRFGSKLLAKLNYLANGIGSSDFQPTDQHGEVQALLNGELKEHLTRLDGLITRDLTAFNELLRARNIPNVVIRPRGPISN